MVNVEEIAKKLGNGKEIQIEGGWSTLCPCHEDKKPSLSLTKKDGKLIVHCHAGCDWKTVKDAIQAKGLLSSEKQDLPTFLWSKSNRNDHVIKKYFSSRNIHIDQIPNCLRLNKHNGQLMMVAAVTNQTGENVEAIHRTFLDSDFRKTDRKMLGKCSGRAAWLSSPAEKMIVGEGIETTLAAMVATGLPGVACLSTSGMKRVQIPKTVKEIIILVDSDPKGAGQKAAQHLADSFSGKALFATPDDSCFTDNPKKLDFNDLDGDQIRERFESLIEPDQAPESINEERRISLYDSEGGKKTKATLLIEIGSQFELFHDPAGEGYATIFINGHHETWAIKSKMFTDLLADQYFILTESGVSRNIIADATDTLRGQARVRGEMHEVHRRVAALDGKIFIDLCDEDWQVVEITKNSWSVVDNPPVKFLRSPSNSSLPIPEDGGSVADLRPLLNINEHDLSLLAGFLIRALQPRPPFFVLCIVGEQGTGKSFVSELIRSFCDPSFSKTSSPPKDDRDFFAGAINNWCVTYDNMSGVQPWLSDSLCRVLTGSSFACRTLYTTTEETSIPLARPVILNGIDDLASRPDLADRAIVLSLQPIDPDKFETNDSLWAKHEDIKAGVFGALLSGISSALKTVNNIDITYKSRMLSATKWAAAAESGMGVDGFIDAYAQNQRDMVIISLESSPFIAALLDMVKEKREWTGTPAGLQGVLPEYARDEDEVKSKAWPKSPAWVTRFLRRHAPALRKIGMTVEMSRDSDERHIHLSMTVNSKKLTPHSRNKNNSSEGDIFSGVNVHHRKNAVTTVMPSSKSQLNDVNDRKKQHLSVYDLESNDGNDSKNSTLSVLDEWEKI